MTYHCHSDRAMSSHPVETIMAFVLPTFNITCDIYDGVFPFAVPRLTSDCNLALGRRVVQPFSAAFLGAGGVYGSVPMLLLPPLTDIRDGACANLPDVVDVPAGSGRWYQVAYVDDVGKGFPNEHRFATLGKLWANAGGILCPGIFWPIPVP